MLAEKAYQYEKARKEQVKRAHGAVLCEMSSTTANFQNSEQKSKIKLSEAFNRISTTVRNGLNVSSDVSTVNK